jgi:hypothetical protein
MAPFDKLLGNLVDVLVKMLAELGTERSSGHSRGLRSCTCTAVGHYTLVMS